MQQIANGKKKGGGDGCFPLCEPARKGRGEKKKKGKKRDMGPESRCISLGGKKRERPRGATCLRIARHNFPKKKKKKKKKKRGKGKKGEKPPRIAEGGEGKKKSAAAWPVPG